MSERSLAVAIFACLGCGGPSQTSKAEVPAAEPNAAVATGDSAGNAKEGRAGVSDAELGRLLEQHWDWVLHHSPVWATTMGDHRFDDDLGDGSEEALTAYNAQKRVWLERARGIDAARLSRPDAITLALFTDSLERAIASEVCESHLWSLSPRDNPITQYNYLPQQHRVESPADGRTLVARYREIPESIDHTIDYLRAGKARGLVVNVDTLRLTQEMVAKELAEPVEGWPLWQVSNNLPEAWPDADRMQIAADLRAAVRDDVAPALRRYQGVLAELVPAARPADQVGLVHLPNGKACYEASIRNYTGLPLTAAELHQIGLEEGAAIDEAMRTLGAELFGTRDLAAIHDRLRNDPALYYTDSASILGDAQTTVARVKGILPRVFGRLPVSDIVVVPTPDYEAPYSTIAYYRQPHGDGSKPGEYVINTYKPELRPRFEMEVLAFHESIPGHHLQIAIAQEQVDLPAFRRYDGSTAFVEGWALYVERLADELGLYSSPLDRMGMLSYDAWRASRLVVDTGLHSMGWTRERAEQYMLDHTALTRTNIVNEVDRYISWPGQALAYKVGQREIRALRARAEKALGARFDLRAFHDRVLENGAVSLPVLRQVIETWIADSLR